MVLVQQPLVVWVIKVALRGGAHVVVAEIRVVSKRQSVFRRGAFHDISVRFNPFFTLDADYRLSEYLD